MRKLRKIVVNGEIYLWKHDYGEDNYNVPLCLRILLKKDRTTEIRIKFPLTDKPIEKCMLNSGFVTTKNAERVIVNLNEPKYIAELIQYLINSKIDFSKDKKYLFENGEQLLNEMGYIFNFA